MNKIKVIALFGPAGSGKDYLLHEIMDEIDGLNEIISCTTRTRREGEINGVNYHFISNQEFYNKVDNGDMLEAVCFNDWWYGTPISSLDPDKLNVGVFNIEGIRCMLEDSRLEVYPVAVITRAKTRLIRQLTREDNPNIREIIRRFDADERDFSFVDFEYMKVGNEDKGNGVCDLANIVNSLI